MGEKSIFEKFLIVDHNFKIAEKVLKKHSMEIKLNRCAIRLVGLLCCAGIGFVAGMIKEKQNRIDELELRISQLEDMGVQDSESTEDEQNM